MVWEDTAFRMRLFLAHSFPHPISHYKYQIVTQITHGKGELCFADPNEHRQYNDLMHDEHDFLVPLPQGFFISRNVRLNPVDVTLLNISF
jgi:hypothetical protein